jgi:hypothetical protein
MMELMYYRHDALKERIVISPGTCSTSSRESLADVARLYVCH